MKATWLVSLATALSLSAPAFAQSFEGHGPRPYAPVVAQDSNRDGRVSPYEHERVREEVRVHLLRERILRARLAREYARAERNRYFARVHYQEQMQQARREHAAANVRAHWE